MAMSVSDLRPLPTQQVESRWRRIVTPIPVPESIPLIRELRAAEPESVQAMPPVVWHEAEGFLVRDRYGNQWIDLTSGIVVANAGHAHPRIVEAIRDAAGRRLLVTYLYPSEARCRLVKKLVDLAPIPEAKAILFSAGTEATECAMMLMRRRGSAISAAKVGILSFESNYHGRTLAASLASGVAGPDDWMPREQVKHFQVPFPFCPRCPWGQDGYDDCGERCFGRCIEVLQRRGVDPEHLAGIIVEPIPGCTTTPMPTDFARAMADWARRNEILLAFDEIQSGCGRTGRFFAFEHVGVTPDLIALGKGLSSSLPVSALIGTSEIMDQPGPGDMSSTHGGNPVCAAAALANLEVIEAEALVEASARTGQAALDRLRERLKDFADRILLLDGRGLFISIHLKRPGADAPDVELADAIAGEAVRRGVMMFVTGRGYLKFVPPLCIDPNAADEAIDVIHECFVELIRG